MLLKRLALACTILLIAISGAAAIGLLPVLTGPWLPTLLISAAVLGLLWVAAVQRQKPAVPQGKEAPPLWAATLNGASPESIAKLEALARDNEHLQQELLARGEQLKHLTDTVKQRREANNTHVSRTAA